MGTPKIQALDAMKGTCKMVRQAAPLLKQVYHTSIAEAISHKAQTPGSKYCALTCTMAGRVAPLLKQVYHTSSAEAVTETPTIRMASAQDRSLYQSSESATHLHATYQHMEAACHKSTYAGRMPDHGRTKAERQPHTCLHPGATSHNTGAASQITQQDIFTHPR